MRLRIFILSLFMIANFIFSGQINSMDKMKEEALQSPSVNLYKIDNDMKLYAEEIEDLIDSLKKLSSSITGSPDHYKLMLSNMNVAELLFSIQENLVNIHDSFGFPNEVLEAKIKKERESAVKEACKPHEQFRKDIKNIMKFEIEDADLSLCQQKLKQIRFNIQG